MLLNVARLHGCNETIWEHDNNADNNNGDSGFLITAQVRLIYGID